MTSPRLQLLHGQLNLQRAEQLTQRYHVEGVPLVVVNGKYIALSKAAEPS